MSSNSTDLSLVVLSTGNGTITVDLSWNSGVLTPIKASLILTEAIVTGSPAETIVKIDVTGLLSYTFTGLTNGQQYLMVYQIQTANPPSSSTITFCQSPPVTATPSTTPSTPVITSPVSLNDGLEFTVTFPTNGGSAYTVMEATLFGNDNTFQTLFVDISNIQTVGQQQVFSFLDGQTYGGVTANVDNYTTYVIAVYTYNANGTSAISNTVEITPSDVPNPPQDVHSIAGTSASFVAESASGTLAIRWDAPSDAASVSPPPVGFTVVTGYYIDISAATFVLGSIPLIGSQWASTTQTNDLSYTIDPSVFATYLGTEFWLSVRAINSVGTGPSASAAENPVIPYTAPSVPRSVAASSPACSTLLVTWLAPLVTGGYPIDHYDISMGGALYSTATGTDLSYTITSLTDGNTYAIQVRAVSTDPTSEDSDWVSTSGLPYCIPDTITCVSIYANPGDQSIHFAWLVPDANGSDITNYVIELSGNTTDVSMNAGLPSGTTEVFYDVTGLNNGESYSYRIYAVNARGTSAASSWCGPVTPVGQPGIPQFVSAIQTGTGQETISFNPPADISGGETNGGVISFYNLYSYTSPSGTVPSLVQQQAATVDCSNNPSCLLTFVEPGLAFGTYKYGIATQIASGEISSISTFTFTVAAVPDVTCVDLSSNAPGVNNRLVFTVNSRGIPLINWTCFGRPATALASGTPFVEGANTQNGTDVQVIVDFPYTLDTSGPTGTCQTGCTYLFSISNANGIGYEYEYYGL